MSFSAHSFKIKGGIQGLKLRPRATREGEDGDIGLDTIQVVKAFLLVLFVAEVPASVQGQALSSNQATSTSGLGNRLCVRVDLSDKGRRKLKLHSKNLLRGFPHVGIPSCLKDIFDLVGSGRSGQLVTTMLMPCLRDHLTQTRFDLALQLEVIRVLDTGFYSPLVRSTRASEPSTIIGVDMSEWIG